MRTRALLPLALAGSALCGPVACQPSGAKAEAALAGAPARTAGDDGTLTAAPRPTAGETAATTAPISVAGPEPGNAVAPSPAAKAIVYYFHTATRCRTCRTIEAYAEEAVREAFGADLEAGRIEWRVVDVEEPSNRHFVDDFDLYASAVVVVHAADPRRYRNLEQVWYLVRDKTAFQRYIQQEIQAFRRS